MTQEDLGKWTGKLAASKDRNNFFQFAVPANTGLTLVVGLASLLLWTTLSERFTTFSNTGVR